MASYERVASYEADRRILAFFVRVTCIAQLVALYFGVRQHVFQNIIQNEAKRQGVSGYRLAKLAGLKLRSVQQYVAGDHDLAGERVALLAAALGLALRPARRTKKGG